MIVQLLDSMQSPLIPTPSFLSYAYNICSLSFNKRILAFYLLFNGINTYLGELPLVCRSTYLKKRQNSNDNTH